MKHNTDHIAHVSPHYGDPVKASGYQFQCPACGFRSPVMKYIEGALRHRRQHTTHASAAEDG